MDLGGNLAIYPINRKGGCLSFTPDTERLVLCLPIGDKDGFAQ